MIARTTSDYLLLENDTKHLYEELKKLVVIVSKENTKTNTFNEKMTDYIVTLNNEAVELRKKVDTEFNDMIESKIMSVLERIKRENHEQWEQTLKYVNTGFKEAKPFIVEPTTKDKLQELATYQDQYQRPAMKNY